MAKPWISFHGQTLNSYRAIWSLCLTRPEMNQNFSEESERYLLFHSDN